MITSVQNPALQSNKPKVQPTPTIQGPKGFMMSSGLRMHTYINTHKNIYLNTYAQTLREEGGSAR